MGSESRPTGDYGEQIASDFLRSKGYEIVSRNHYTSHAELDIVALSPEGDAVVFVEVKSRTVGVSEKNGRPASAVGSKKQKNLIFAAKGYMRMYPELFEGRSVRIDVIEIYLSPGAPPRVHHIRSAITARRGYNTPRG